MNAYDTSIALGDNGRRYLVEYHYDLDCGAPWENEDGHGPVRRTVVDHWTGQIRKRPGEVVLKNGGARDDSYLYDFAEAMKRAKAEGWNAEPYDAPGRALRAVHADMAHLRDWLNDRWHYVGVVVVPLTEDGDELRSKSASLWGIESGDAEVLEQTAAELVGELESEYEEEEAVA